jgi:crotonobetainyl-CoA:carnitine CoA-transferase CaiB-like acyl-CoA transferase
LNELILDDNYATNTNRVKNRSELFTILNTAISIHSSVELMKIFIEKDIPAGIVKSLKDVFSEKESEGLVLTDENEALKIISKRVKTAVFNVK